MLVKDGQEINPDQEEETENQKDDLRLSNEEIEEAVRAYAEYKRGKTQQVKAAPAAPRQKQPEPEEDDEGTDDAYGEYERVPAKQTKDPDDYPTGIAAVKETFAPILSRINIKVVGLALVALVLGIAGYRSYIAKVEDVVTATPEPAAVQSDQPAQSVDQPAPQPPANCTWTTEMAKITSKDNGQVCLSSGTCFAVDIQTLGTLQVGQEIPQQVCK